MDNAIHQANNHKLISHLKITGNLPNESKTVNPSLLEIKIMF